MGEQAINRRVQQAPRPLDPMNVDLNDRPFYVTDNDELVSEFSYTYSQPDGSAILIPGVYQGNILEEWEARNLFHQTGKHLGVFSSIDDADRYAKDLSRTRGHEGQWKKDRGDRFERAQGQEVLQRHKERVLRRQKTKEATEETDR